jgi:hypothetical protein
MTSAARPAAGSAALRLSIAATIAAALAVPADGTSLYAASVTDEAVVRFVRRP